MMLGHIISTCLGSIRVCSDCSAGHSMWRCARIAARDTHEQCSAYDTDHGT